MKLQTKQNVTEIMTISKLTLFTSKFIWPLKSWFRLKPITRWQILDWSKLKQFADDNFKFDENSRKFFK